MVYTYLPVPRPTVDDTRYRPPGPIFNARLLRTKYDFNTYQTARFRKSCRRDLSNDTLFGIGICVDAECLCNRGLKIGRGVLQHLVAPRSRLHRKAYRLQLLPPTHKGEEEYNVRCSGGSVGCRKERATHRPAKGHLHTAALIASQPRYRCKLHLLGKLLQRLLAGIRGRAQPPDETRGCSTCQAFKAF